MCGLGNSWRRGKKKCRGTRGGEKRGTGRRVETSFPKLENLVHTHLCFPAWIHSSFSSFNPCLHTVQFVVGIDASQISNAETLQRYSHVKRKVHFYLRKKNVNQFLNFYESICKKKKFCTATYVRTSLVCHLCFVWKGCQVAYLKK